MSTHRKTGPLQRILDRTELRIGAGQNADFP